MTQRDARKTAYCIAPCIWVWNFSCRNQTIADLERRQKALEDEIAKASLHASTDDPMILDLKRRVLHLRDELEKFRHKAAFANRWLH